VMTLIVTCTMAAISGTQLWFDLRSDLRDQQRRLGDSLAPLAAEMQTAQTRQAARAALLNFHGAYSDRGEADHHLAVIDDTGRTLIQTGSQGPNPNSTVSSAVRIVAPALGPGEQTLLIATTGADFDAMRERRWRDWAAHVGATAALTLAMLFVVIRREVMRPIDRLLEGVRKMELGYWDDMPDPGGAWELRWLGWRFRVLGQELNVTVENLVAAQRRSFAMEPRSSDTGDVPIGTDAAPAAATTLHAGAVLTRMKGRLARLGCGESRCAADRALAQLVWDQEAPLAERLGRPELSAALEDAALRILDPAGFTDIHARIELLRPSLELQARGRKVRLERALSARDVRVIEMQWRIKHAAGAWRKMQQKHLRVEQLHDLVALRIIVPAEADCYHALGAVHDLYPPLVGRFKDYILAPKPNGYRSLHCSVRDADGSVFEVQIRSAAMHKHAETGAASHAEYRDLSSLRQTIRSRSLCDRVVSAVRSWLQGSRRGP
jgi:HAMP domain-containing protein